MLEHMALLGWLLLSCVGFAAAGPPGGLVVMALWFVVAYMPGQKREKQLKARYFEDDEMIDTLSLSFSIDFAEMTATEKSSDVGWEHTRHYLIQRADQGQWLRRYTPKGRDEEVARIKKALAEGQIGASKADLAEAQANEWQRLDGHFASKVEVAYQAYLRTL